MNLSFQNYGEKKGVKIRFWLFFKIKKKVPMAFSTKEGGGGALLTWPLLEELFCCDFSYI